MHVSNSLTSADPDVSKPAGGQGLWPGGVCAVLVHVSRMAQRCDPRRTVGGRACWVGVLVACRAGSRSGGRPSSEVSRVDTDGVRTRPWAHPLEPPERTDA